MSPFTSSARKESVKAHADKLPRPSHPALYACATASRAKKFASKGTGADQRGQLFLPIVNTSNGAFVPQDPTTLKVHTEAAKKYFEQGLKTTLARAGTRPRSVDEGLIRRWARGAADIPKSGIGAFDASLALLPAAGLITAHYYRQIAYQAIKNTCNGILEAIKRNLFRFFV